MSAEVEISGLDIPEMGVPGYPEFVPPTDVSEIPPAEIAAAKQSIPQLGVSVTHAS